ncbi:MAG: ATP-binding cassette domain-containing protein [Synergistaceae bacterium]|jgi:D-methionine transport system ATP-binding protein|nr:ATP-binding cassette domain-containing protein [Synergistaceae bacterium]
MIAFRNVGVVFETNKGAVHAVRDVSFTIERESVFGIIGASGAGKSTLLRTINGLEKPTSGEVQVDGQIVNHLSTRKMREHREGIGMIFQHFNLIVSKTVAQNIAYPLKIAGKNGMLIGERVDELLKLVDLEDKKHVYPAKLSGGQKQRVGIARALANHTKILLCDEPTSALDAETTKTILQLLKRLSQELGITIVLITHELDVVSSICDKVAVMSEGRVVETGGIYDVFTNPREEYTKKLLETRYDFAIPAEALEKIRWTNAEQGRHWKIIRLDYIGEKAYEPVISRISKQFDVEIDVIHGKIEYIQGKPAGRMYVALSGEREEAAKTLAYLAGQVHSVEILYEQQHEQQYSRLT